MKAEIKKDGYLHIIAETPTEAFAIKHLFGHNEEVMLAKEDVQPPPILMNFEVLNHNPSTVRVK